LFAAQLFRRDATPVVTQSATLEPKAVTQGFGYA
jgi:hypothetical protein